MTKSNLFVQAHKMTMEDMKLYTNLNYRVQFGMNLKALYSKKEMVEYAGKGSEKQVKWAKDILEKANIEKIAKIAKELTFEEIGFNANEKNERDYNNLNNMISWLLNKDAKWIIENRNNLGDVNLLDEYKKLFMEESKVEKFSIRAISAVIAKYWEEV